jgi:undecaprenyl pyrophosphate phosphatase UppP
MAVMILVGSLPTAAVGLLLRDVFQRFFTSPAIVGLCLWITGFFLVWSRWARQHRKHLDSPNVLEALVIGLAQGAAISPGVSRSASGLKRHSAFPFSYRFLPFWEPSPLKYSTSVALIQNGILWPWVLSPLLWWVGQL